jgi:hypothetical protein
MSFDARTGAPVDCLPKEREPYYARFTDGHVVVASSAEGMARGMEDHSLYLNAIESGQLVRRA